METNDVNEAAPSVDVPRLVRDSFPADPHEEQTHAIKKPSCEFITEAAKQGWQWVAASYHGVRFMVLPNDQGRATQGAEKE